MIVNWFSPLEPDTSSIPYYSNMMLPWLARETEVRVWTTQQSYSKDISKHAEVRQYHPDALPWPELHRGDLTIFHIGSPVASCLDIWAASMQLPGIVVLHDVLCSNALDVIRHAIRDGRITNHIAIPKSLNQRPAPSCPYASLRALLDNATAALIHSQEHFDSLAGALDCALILAPLPYEPASADTLRKWRGLRDRERRSKRIIVLGVLEDNPLVPSLLELMTKRHSEFELQLCATRTDIPAIENRVEALKLEESVKVTDCLSDIDIALAQADLAINLTDPTAAEANLNQLRIWDHGLPSIVTRAGCYTSLLDNSVLFLRPDSEMEDVTMHVEGFLANPERYAQVGANGRSTLIAHHSPGDYAQALLALAEQGPSFQCTAAARKMGYRVAEEIKNWLDPKERASIEHFAEEISRIFG